MTPIDRGVCPPKVSMRIDQSILDVVTNPMGNVMALRDRWSGMGLSGYRHSEPMYRWSSRKGYWNPVWMKGNRVEKTQRPLMRFAQSPFWFDRFDQVLPSRPSPELEGSLPLVLESGDSYRHQLSPGINRISGDV